MFRAAGQVARPRRRPLPIRYRLALSYGVAMFLTLLLFSGALYALLVRSTLQEVDRLLAAEAQMVAVRVNWAEGWLGAPSGWPPLPGGRVRLAAVFVEVRDRSGQVLFRSTNLGGQPIPSPTPASATARYDTVWVEDTPLRVYSLPVRGPGGTLAYVVTARPIDAQLAFISRLRWALVLANAGLLLLTGALAVFIAGRALRPLSQIAETAREIGRSRDFSRRVPTDLPDDEVGQLAVAFNQMLDRIAAAYDELDRAYRQAQAAYEAQRRFAADASHELRTPLTVLQANLELLRDDQGDERERAEALADMEAEVHRMSRLVNNLLVLARADAGQRLEKRPTRLRPLLEEVVHRARAVSGGRVIELEVGEEITLQADPDALQQLLWILVENAVKYTGEDGRIVVGAEDTGSEVILRVRDNGIGIEPEEQERIFERFYRAPRARALDGSGLGLSIARWVVEQYGGRIEVSSTPGEGSEFTVRLPRAP